MKNQNEATQALPLALTPRSVYVATLRKNLKFHLGRAELHKQIAACRRDYYQSGDSQDRIAQEHWRKADEIEKQIFRLESRPNTEVSDGADRNDRS